MATQNTIRIRNIGCTPAKVLVRLPNKTSPVIQELMVPVYKLKARTYQPVKKAPSKRDLHRQEVAERKH